MTSGYRAAIFDMDGTLLDSMRYWRLAGAEYVRTLGIEPPAQLLDPTRTVKQSIEFIIEAGWAQCTPEELFSRFKRQIFGHYMSDARLKPGVERVLEALLGAGVECCIATATPMWMAGPVIDRLGLRKYMKLCLSNEDLGLGKGDPAYFVRVAERMGCGVRECVVFEDALYAIGPAKRAGFAVCAIEDAAAAKDQAEIMALADRYLRSWDELSADARQGLFLAKQCCAGE